MTLKNLLKEVDNAFGIDKLPAGLTFVYMLGPIRNTWQFNVTDNWYSWSDKNYETNFQGQSPEECIQCFLSYIQLHKINPYKLRHGVENARRKQRKTRV